MENTAMVLLRRSSPLLLLVCLAAGCSPAGARRGSAATETAAEVPSRFERLYSELDRELAAAEKTAPDLTDSGRPCPAMAPGLYLASSYFGPAGPGTPRWNDLMAALDGFQALGADAVSIMISFPDLTPGVKDPEPLLKFYGALADEVRARKMKLLVEHFVYPPSAPTREGKFVAGIKTLPDPKGSFLHLSGEEIKLILSRIKPDYLSVITEPGTFDRFLGISISAEEYSRWLEGFLADLAGSGGKGAAKIGAGAGAWEPELYVSSFAKVKGLDYIDIHFYPMALGTENIFQEFIKLLDQVKTAAPSKEIVVSETWLYKHGADEPKGVFYTEAYGRNAYDFWSPLDARFFELMNTVGRKKGISVIAPYFPQYFFTDWKFDPAATPRWPGGLANEWQRALEAARRRSVSPTGAAFRAMLGRCQDGPR